MLTFIFPELEHLDCSSNVVTSVPDFATLTCLTSLDLSRNLLEVLPMHMLNLPGKERALLFTNFFHLFSSLISSHSSFFSLPSCSCFNSHASVSFLLRHTANAPSPIPFWCVVFFFSIYITHRTKDIKALREQAQTVARIG